MGEKDPEKPGNQGSHRPRCSAKHPHFLRQAPPPHPGPAPCSGSRMQDALLRSYSHPEAVLAHSFPVTLYTALSCHGHGSNAAPDCSKGPSKGSPTDELKNG